MIYITTILVTHWIADFIFQDEKWASSKSKNTSDLLKHTSLYSTLWFIPMVFIIGVYSSLIFIVVTFIFHTLTDYFTSKIVTKRFEQQYYGSKIPNFGAFTIIGFDQLLHYLQLFLTFKILL